MRTIYPLIILLVMATPGFGQVENKTFGFVLRNLLSHQVPEITVEQALKTTGAAVFLDAREREEYDVSHIQNARFIGYKNFDLSRLHDLPKDRPIIVYCAVGKRSENITESLMKAGYTDVYNLYGGIFEWKNKGNPVYDNNNRATENVHAYSRLWGKFLTRGQKVF